MNSHEPSRVLAAALAYAALGWRIFPCDPHAEKPRSKRPLVAADRDEDGRSIEGTGWPKKASCDPDIIRGWWRKWPDAMIGMSPAWAGAFVIDLDPKGEPVEAVEARLVAALGGPLPVGPRTVTQSGGRHLWFRRPPGGPFGNDRPGLANIDIRCDNGYVILPPSTLRNGNSYAWESAAYEGDAPDLPQGVLDLIAAARGPKPAEARNPVLQANGPAKPIASDRPGEVAVRRWVGAARDNIATDLARTSLQRGTALYSAARQFGRFVAAGGMSEREAIATLMDAAEVNGLVETDGAISVERDIRRGLTGGAANAGEIIGRLREIAREAEERAARTNYRPPPGQPEDYERGGRAAGRAERADVVDAPDDGGERTGGDDLPVDDVGAPSGPVGAFNLEVVRKCAAYDHSDTDNGQRLIAHFGDQLRVIQRKGVRNLEYLAWAGTHWDLDTGQDRAHALAQRIGDLIGLEADQMTQTPDETRAIEAARQAAEELTDLDRVIDTLEEEIRAAGRAAKPDKEVIWTKENAMRKARGRRYDVQRLIDAGAQARAELNKRQVARRRFGVSSKNDTRLKAMLSCAAPHLTVAPQQLNADALRLATDTHTLVFRREEDPDCPDPDVRRYVARVDAVKGHDPADLITFRIPQPYDPQAKCPKWLALLERFQPIASNRSFLQVFAGLGLLGVTVQKLLFNYGEGANAKSVVMQTIFNVLGDLAVNLEAESIVGTDVKAGGSASPDLIKLMGKRFLRIAELPEGDPIREALVKKLTGGGEEISARGLYQGMVDFVPVFSAMMSGNGYPKVEGTNHGIWRRIAVLHWPVTIPENEQRELNQVLDEFRPEYPGILNWLIDGALTYLRDGLVLPDEVKAATQTMRESQDPTALFCSACVAVAPGETVLGAELYDAYTAFCAANGIHAVHLTSFGKRMGAKYKREDGRVRTYHDIRLHDVPERPSKHRRHDDEPPPHPGYETG